MAAILLGSGNVRLTASTDGAHKISRVPIAVAAADILGDRVVLGCGYKFRQAIGFQ